MMLRRQTCDGKRVECLVWDSDNLFYIEVSTDTKASGESSGKEHALVMFEKDESLSIIPRNKIVSLEVDVHQPCTVKWTDGKKYNAEVLFLGKHHY